VTAAVARPDADRVACGRCAVTFRPDLTDGECPICREPAPGSENVVRDGTEHLDLRTVIVVGMSAVNLLFLAVLAAVLFG
jgi:hypothetical protein